MMKNDRPVLNVRELTVRFGGLSALTNVTFRVGHHEIVGLIGPNGAGKTTALNVIAGLYRPTRGEVTFGENRLDRHLPHQVASLGIARTFQNIRLFRSMTVLENVLVGFHSRTKAGFFRAILRDKAQRLEEEFVRERATALLHEFHLAERADDLATSLPYSQQKSVELMRALAAEPAMLLLDEPAAGMSVADRTEFRERIAAISSRGISVLLVEHDVHTVMATCKRVVVLDHGIKITEGSPSDVQSNERVVEAYLGEEED